ncbi:hypothetical protein KAX35_09050 [candidate division WOR-3 bacterium]|nr:hypothetical protein [candidate division WOR-3 bacterium]
MEGSKKIVIGNKMITRKELFEEHEKFRKEQAKLPFEEKIRALIDLQKIAYNWGKKKDVIVWRSEKRGTAHI